MNAIKTFEDLQELGCSSIHENTHIARSKVDQLLNKSFGQINRIQFMGFVSILEREYNISLDDLRREYDEYIDSHPDTTITKKSAILQAKPHSKKWWIAGGLLFIITLIVLASKTQNSLESSPDADVLQLNSASVEVVEMNTSDVNVTDTNSSEINVSKLPIIPTTDSNQSSVSKSSETNFGNISTIIPINKVWVGMLDIETGMKTQKITDQPITLTNTKETLFMFGHGRLMLVDSDKNSTLDERHTVWFLYEKGKLYQLSHAQFRSKNRGANW
jgi:hypothetical protein